MDTTLLYYSPAEIEYRRQRAARSLRSRRRKARSPWRRRHESDATA